MVHGMVKRQAPAPSSEPRPTRGLLFLAEDDGELRWALSEILRERGWEVVELGHGAALLDRLSGSILEGHAPTPAAIVTDVRMPGVNGLSIVGGLRALGCTTPVVLISAFGDPETRSLVESWPGAAFLDKPVDGDLLDETLRALIAAGPGATVTPLRPDSSSAP